MTRGNAADDKVDINSASLEQLMSPKYVGETIAKRIVVYRDQIQGFKRAEEINGAKGFGPDAWVDNRERIFALPCKKT